MMIARETPPQMKRPQQQSQLPLELDNCPPVTATKTLNNTAVQTTKPQSKWTANAARIVLAPVDINTSTNVVDQKSAPPSENEKSKSSARPTDVAEPIPSIPIHTNIASNTTAATSTFSSSSTVIPSSTRISSSKMTLAELEDREVTTKESMTIAGKACMDAWNAALEASRAYRAVRKEWRRAKAKLEKRLSKTSPMKSTAPIVALVDAPLAETDEAQIDEGDEVEDMPPTILEGESSEANQNVVTEPIDEVEQMEEAVHAVEQTEVQYAALTHQTEVEEAAAEEEEDEECADQADYCEGETQIEGETDVDSLALSTVTGSSSTSTGHPQFGVLTFSFGGNKLRTTMPQRQHTGIATRQRPTASDKARALALKLKLEADMAAHESRRLALQEAARLKSLENERRRQMAKEKVDEALARRTHGKSDEQERKRLEAESRRQRAAAEEKRIRLEVKRMKRRELQQTIEEMKGKEKKKHQHQLPSSSSVSTVPTTTSSEGQ